MVLRLTLNRDVHHILIRQIRIKSLNVDFGEHGRTVASGGHFSQRRNWFVGIDSGREGPLYPRKRTLD